MKHAILYVDDESRSLKYFQRLLNDQYQIYTATNATEGYKLVKEKSNEIAIIMADQRMPGETGLQLLQKTYQLNPEIVRIMVTAYSDINLAIKTINEAQIYKFVEKPWDVTELVQLLNDGLAYYALQKPCWRRKGAGKFKNNDLSQLEFPSWSADIPYTEAKHSWTTFFEKNYIVDALTRSNGNVSHAAQSCDMDRRTLQRLSKRLNLR